MGGSNCDHVAEIPSRAVLAVENLRTSFRVSLHRESMRKKLARVEYNIYKT